MAVAFALGEATLGFVAWMTKSWRLMLRVLYAPGIILIVYGWFAPESVRWLLSKGKMEEARRQLLKVARVNGKVISDDMIRKLDMIETKADDRTEISLINIFSSLPLFLRLINCSFCWICVTFTYYGLSMQSVLISGNLYINYIAVAAIEIPAFVVTYYTLDRFGRRITQSVSLILSGICCVAFIFMDDSK